MLASELEKGQDTSKTRQFIELYDLQWSKEVSRQALTTLEEAKWNRSDVDNLPMAADIQRMHSYLDAETARSAGELKEKPSAGTYKQLAELVLTSLILFNRRRQGEASAITVTSYQKALTANTEHPEVTAALSEFEKHLAGSLLRVVVRGKKGRGVPVLFTEAMRSSVTLLMEAREAAGANASPYLFANTMSADLRPLRGCDCLRKFARQSGVANPTALTSTKLRKHIATMSQLLNLKDNELDLLASFLGHDIRVHRETYRMPEATTQLAMVSKLLMASEKGLAGWRGQSLADIEVSETDTEQQVQQEQNSMAGPSGERPERSARGGTRS